MKRILIFNSDKNLCFVLLMIDNLRNVCKNARLPNKCEITRVFVKCDVTKTIFFIPDKQESFLISSLPKDLMIGFYLSLFMSSLMLKFAKDSSRYFCTKCISHTKLMKLEFLHFWNFFIIITFVIFS